MAPASVGPAGASREGGAELRQRGRAAHRAAERSSQAQPARGGDEEWEYVRVEGAGFYVRQYSGLVLGLAACVGTVYTAAREGGSGPWDLVGWLFLALVSLVAHELRPWKGPGLKELFQSLKEPPAGAQGGAPAGQRDGGGPAAAAPAAASRNKAE